MYYLYKVDYDLNEETGEEEIDSRDCVRPIVWMN